MSLLEALVLGAVQGVTEFLPISSDGHLALVTHLFAQENGTVVDGSASLFFNVMLHLGTLAAIVFFYRSNVAAGARGLMGRGRGESPWTRKEIVRIGVLTAVATVPAAVAGLGLKPQIEWLTEVPWATGVGFLITAAVLLMTMRQAGGSRGIDRMTWADALAIGVAQAFALLPGVSRSGMTIAAALALGLSRSASVGFSLLMAVAAISGAGVLELKDVDPARLDPRLVQQIVVATAVSAAVGYIAVVALVRIVQRGWIWYFSVYLVLLAGFVFWKFPPPRLAGDESTAAALDGTVRPPLGAMAGARAER